MLTRAGFLALVAGIVTAAAGRVFGLVEILALGLALVAVVIVALTIVLLPRPRLDLARVVRPGHVPAGDPARVDLRIQNTGALPTGVLWLHDQVAGTPGATMRSAPLARHRPVTASYRLPTAERGVIAIGPLTVDGADPLGFARRRLVELGTTELVVYPKTEKVAAPPRPSAAEMATAIHATTVDHVGDEFHALRPYQVGDDLRRVHWPATARHDQLMIRQHDDTRETRTVALLDTRHSTTSDHTFEQMVSAAASVLAAAHERGDEIALITTDGTVDMVGVARHDLDLVLDRLARVNRARDASLARAAVAVDRAPVQGTLVAVLGGGTDESSELLRVARPFAATIVVRFPSAGSTGFGEGAVVGPGEPFAPSWHRALAARAGSRPLGVDRST